MSELTPAEHAATVREYRPLIPSDAERVRFDAALDALAKRATELERERAYLRQFSNPGEVDAVAAKINIELEERAERAEVQLSDIRRQMEQLRDEGKWPLSDVLARSERAEARATELERQADQYRSAMNAQVELREAAEQRAERAEAALTAIEDALGDIRLDELPLQTQKAINYAWACAREKRGNPELIPEALARREACDE